MKLWNIKKPRGNKYFEDCWFIWVTNAGAAEITANSIASLQAQHLGAGQKLMVGLLDHTAGQIIQDKVDTNNLEFLFIQDLPASKKLNLDLPSTYDNYGTKNFNLRCTSKYVLIDHLLREERSPVIFADGDIVYLSNPVKHFENNASLSDRAVLFQNDRPAGVHDAGVRTQYRMGHLPNASSACTGFSVWRPHAAHFRLAGTVRDGINLDRDDQSTLNGLNAWRKRYVQLLRQDLFPNGSFVFAPEGAREDVFDRKKALLVHANWMLGIEEKVKRLKAAGFWLT